ncbi:hypothetical protein Tco_1147750 [Tanacetum coccineum]
MGEKSSLEGKMLLLSLPDVSSTLLGLGREVGYIQSLDITEDPDQRRGVVPCLKQIVTRMRVPPQNSPNNSFPDPTLLQLGQFPPLNEPPQYEQPKWLYEDMSKN